MANGHEADLVTRFGKMVKDGLFADSVLGSLNGGFEFKAVKFGRSLPFKCVPEHQIAALRKCKSGGSGESRHVVGESAEGKVALGDSGLWHKISDVGMGYKPFDCFLIVNSCGWLVIGWYDVGGAVSGKKWPCVVVMDVVVFVREREKLETSGVRSLSMSRAMDIGHEIDLYRGGFK